MGRLVLTGALLMLLLAIAQASTHRTIITTVIDEPNKSEAELCIRQIQPMKVGSCMSYLKPNMILPRMGGQAQQCCNDLKEVSEKCRCEGIVHIARGVTGQGWGGPQPSPQKMKEVMQKAQQLPQQCGFPQKCKIPQAEH